MNSYIVKLVDGLSLSFTNNTPLELDLVLDGGAFNGSYLIGIMLMIKEMEKRNYIHINRISACSVSTLCAILYYIDKLELGLDIYEKGIKHVKEKHNLDIFDTLFNIIKPNISEELCKKITQKLYCSYYNVKKGKKIIKSSYLNSEDLLETIRRSCHLPYLMNNKVVYKEKYVDGITPYKFKDSNNTKILYIDLFGIDKILYCMSCKRETQNFHRIMAGALDIHLFFTKGKNTSMCRYITDWTLYKFYDTFYIKILIEKALVYYFSILYTIEIFLSDKKKRPAIAKLYDLFIKEFNKWYFHFFCY